MSAKQVSGKPSRQEAQRLITLLNIVSLFSRRTLMAWLPELKSEMDITAERFMVMHELNRQPEISLKELAERLSISPSSLSVMINSLTEQGIVTRLPDPADRRRVVLRLGSQGENHLQMAEEHLIAQFQTFLKNLPKTERQKLDSAAENLQQIMDRILKQY